MSRGRGKGARARLLALLRANISDDELKQIIAKNKRDALGLHVVTITSGTDAGKQKIEDDPASDAHSRAKARQQIYEYLMGKAPQPIEIEEEAGLDSLLDQLGERELDAIIRLGDASGIGGTGAPSEAEESGSE